MRILFISIVMLFSSLTISAQDWQTDFNKCKSMAKANNKKIILVFSGSDWCAPCMKLDNQIWQSDEFQAYAKEHFVLFKADFSRRKKNRLSKEQQIINGQLADKYNQSGYFPLVVVFDADAKVLGTLGYENVSPKKYIEMINSL